MTWCSPCSSDTWTPTARILSCLLTITDEMRSLGILTWFWSYRQQTLLALPFPSHHALNSIKTSPCRSHSSNLDCQYLVIKGLQEFTASSLVAEFVHYWRRTRRSRAGHLRKSAYHLGVSIYKFCRVLFLQLSTWRVNLLQYLLQPNHHLQRYTDSPAFLTKLGA